MGVGRLRGKAGEWLGPGVPSTPRPQREDGLGSVLRDPGECFTLPPPLGGLSALKGHGEGAAVPTHA